MTITKLSKRKLQWTAKFLLLIMVFEIVSPLQSFALTSGPSQPEMQSFEPVGTTNLVDLQSGDFTYNIPLLDIEGYPINIAYHSGVNVEQEASWVGLGWNINPGNVSHMVRGIPDDFNGDVIKKEIKINDDNSTTFDVSVRAELFGIEAPSSVGLGLALGMNFSNYSGLSMSMGPTAGFSTKFPIKGTGLMGGLNANYSFGASTSNGANFSQNYGASVTKSENNKNLPKVTSSTIAGSFGQQYNSSQGLQNTSFGVNPSLGYKAGTYRLKKSKKNRELKYNGGRASFGGFNSSHTPIALSNYVPVITNAFISRSSYYQIRGGGEIYGVFVSGSIGIGASKTSVLSNGDKKAYGFFNLENAGKADVVDFSRDRDGRFHPKMHNLPPGNMTYDLFSVSGQGTGGSYRAFRDDIGYVYDPLTTSDSKSRSILGDLGAGNLLEGGLDKTKTLSTSHSGPWTGAATNRKFKSKSKGSLYEPYYMKQAGELSLTNTSMSNAISLNTPSKLDKALTKSEITNMPLYSENVDINGRVPRSNLMYFRKASEASHAGVSLNPRIENYKTPGIYDATKADGRQVPDHYSRVGGYRKKHHISEVVQVVPDGRRYVYGIPAMNISQKEYLLSVDAATSGGYSLDKRKGIMSIPSAPTNGTNTGDLGQNLFMKTTTPAHAHSYLLTNILSSDYVDITGDGISDDDLGSFTKFNYSMISDKFVWRTPYTNGQGRLDLGVKSDCHDDKATFVTGRKEVWELHSIETKNYVAEFYTSPRVDAAGAQKGPIAKGVDKVPLYKLDRIVLYNKKDRLENGPTAKSIKEIKFAYDYSLCKGVLNRYTTGAATGKLTLKGISIKNGVSDIGLLTPYTFEYGENKPYDQFATNCWGGYKPDGSNNHRGTAATGNLDLTNHEYPYVNQHESRSKLDEYASTWNLEQINLPSGGTINVEYEADDYAYVQDKEAMQMFKVEGCGASPNYNSATSLYQSKTNPFLYLYFKRDAAKERGTMRESYVGGAPAIQYTFDINLNPGEQTPSCKLPLIDKVKGYADILEIDECANNSSYGYIKIKPKLMDQTGKFINDGFAFGQINKLKINPITAAAINYARYYNNKALNPASELVNPNAGQIIEAFGKAFGKYADYVRNPMVHHMNNGLAKTFNKNRSYIRLKNLDGHKVGGGHRVSRVTFSDQWDEMVGGAPVATYGSEYEYDMPDPKGSGNPISSGVATYEPLVGGDENPWRKQLDIDRVGNDNAFPMVDPIELINEAPVGEAFFPSASVGYSKVRVKSIHKDAGRSSQLVQEHEFYTAKDFPVKVEETQISKSHDRPAKLTFKLHKKEKLELGQGYAIHLNDMHGKPKRQSVWVNKNGKETLVSYKKHKYHTKDGNKSELDNEVQVLTLNNNNWGQTPKELGVERDYTVDTRKKRDITTTTGFSFNFNLFLIGIIPSPIPTPFPKIPKSTTKTFQSVVGTKIIQKYGILESVETFDKGATVKLTNEVYDPVTGQVLLTSVNTEHEDTEFNLKNPAYWAYDGLGPAYENINYEEKIGEDNRADNKETVVANDIVYAEVENLDRFNVGDEVILDVKESCGLNNGNLMPNPKSYKMWVVDKGSHKVPTNEDIIRSNPDLVHCDNSGCSTPIGTIGSNYSFPNIPITYDFHTTCGGSGGLAAPYYYSTTRNGPSPIDYSNIINSFVASNQSKNLLNHHDVCHIPFQDLFSQQIIRPYLINNIQYNQLSTSGGNKITLGYDYLINKPGISALRDLIIGPSVTHSIYPLEYAYFNLNHSEYLQNGNSNSWTLLPLNGKIDDQMSVSFPNWVVNGVCTLKNHNMGYRDHKKHSSTVLSSVQHFTQPRVLKARKINHSAYNIAFQSYPNVEIGTSSHYLEIEIILKPQVDMTVQNGLNSSTFRLQDPNLPNQNSFVKPFTYVHRFRFPCQASNNIGMIQNALNTMNTPNFVMLDPPNVTIPYQPFILSSSDLVSGASYSFSSKLMYKASAEIIQRQKPSKDVLVLKSQKRDMESFDGTITASNDRWNGTPLPSNDIIKKATIKVTRSGKRNQLSETVQNIASLTNPLNSGGSTPKMENVISLSANTYSNKGYVPQSVAGMATDWHNEYVTGLLTSYKPERNYMYHANRDGINVLDKLKGLILDPNSTTASTIDIPSFWSIVNGMFEQTSTTTTWHPKSRVLKYDAWGNDLEVKDASGAIHSNIFGYGHKLPTAVVSNSQSDNAIFENFEDVTKVSYWSYIKQVFNYTQNDLRAKVFDEILNNGSTNLELASGHTGTNGIKVNSGVNVNVEFADQKFATTPNTDRALSSFYFRPDQKYYVSYWQQFPRNAAIHPFGKFRIGIGGSTYSFKAITPNIDGWVQFAGSFTTPSAVSGNAAFVLLSGMTFDDLRIIPSKANMKSYVYNAQNQRLVAVLDENNMATKFDYSAEGKLQRIKKETERGLLTLKESRESLRAIIDPGAGSSWQFSSDPTNGLTPSLLPDASTYYPAPNNNYPLPN